MLKIYFYKLFNKSKTKKIIIFSIVMIFAIYALISISLYSINFPFSDDWPSVFAAIYFQQNDPIWINTISDGRGEHFQYFYRTVMMLGFLLNSITYPIHIMYLNWIFLAISVGIFYLILRKTDTRITWLIIPISALIFSPKVIQANLLASAGLAWIGLFVFLVSVVGILNMKKLTWLWLSLAICLSIFATFNLILGLLTWIIGICFLVQNFNKNRKKLVIWIIFFVIIFSYYISIIELKDSKHSIENIYDIDAVLWSLQYVSNPFPTFDAELRELIGVISIISFISISIYLAKKQINGIFPWIIFGVIGILSMLVTTIGRFGVRPPTTSYFVIMSNFIQIALVVVVTILLLEVIRSHKKWSKIAIIIYLIFIASQITLIGGSYYYSSQRMINYNSTFEQYLSCFDFPSNIDDCDRFNVFGNPKSNSDVDLEEGLDTFNMLMEKKLGIFSSEYFHNIEKKKNTLIEKVNMLNNGSGVGDIQFFNRQEISQKQIILLEDSTATLSGWMIGKNGNVSEIVLFVDDKPFASTTRVWQEPEIIEKYHLKYNTKGIEWSISIFSVFFEEGCHKISIKGIYENTIFNVDKEFILCKK